MLDELYAAVSLGRVDYEKHPERKYIFPGMWESWDPQKGRRRPLRDAAISSLGLVRTKTAVLIKLMQSGGVGLLAGSDSGASNTLRSLANSRRSRVLV